MKQTLLPSKTSLFAILALTILCGSCKKYYERLDPIGAHINDDLWAYYKFNGNLADSSGNNHELTLLNGATLANDKNGTQNYAVDFDGLDDYGVIPDGTIFPASDFTVSMFVLPRENRGLFFGKHNYASAKAASFNVGIDVPTHGPVARFSVTTNQQNICNEYPVNGEVILNGSELSTSSWYHMVATFEQGTMKFYINNVLVGTKALTFSQINDCINGEFVLASWWTGDHNAFNGKLDELRIYTRAIKPAEIEYLFKGPKIVVK